MQKIDLINQQICKLQKQKEDLETRLACVLFKKLQEVLGKAFTPEIALALVMESWGAASSQQKEIWQKKAHSFRLVPRPTKTA